LFSLQEVCTALASHTVPGPIVGPDGTLAQRVDAAYLQISDELRSIAAYSKEDDKEHWHIDPTMWAEAYIFWFKNFCPSTVNLYSCRVLACSSKMWSVNQRPKD